MTRNLVLKHDPARVLLPDEVRVCLAYFLVEEEAGLSRAAKAGRLILYVVGLLTKAERKVLRTYPWGQMRASFREAMRVE